MGGALPLAYYVSYVVLLLPLFGSTQLLLF